MGYQEHRLLDSQWDAVYEVVKEEGFNPSDFTRSSTTSFAFSGSIPTLIHKPTGSEFVFDYDPQHDEDWAEWSPATDAPRGRDRAAEGFGFVLVMVRIWLKNIQRELTTPNLWALIEQQREELRASIPSGDTANTPFSPEEQAPHGNSARSRNSWSTTTEPIRARWRVASSS